MTRLQSDVTVCGFCKPQLRPGSLVLNLAGLCRVASLRKDQLRAFEPCFVGLRDLGGVDVVVGNRRDFSQSLF